MLKGHVFKKQIFGNQVCALIFDKLLNGKNGIFENYKNAMNISYNNSSIIINSGIACIQGRPVEEDTATTILAGTDTAFCRLVIEIDLDKENTQNDFVQAQYRIVKGVTTYPELTQSNIVKNNSGVYQYELAQFKTSLNGISDFVDKRTFLFKSDKVVLTGNITVPANSKDNSKFEADADVEIQYPENFTKENTGIVSIATSITNGSIWSTGTVAEQEDVDLIAYHRGILPCYVTKNDKNLIFNVYNALPEEVNVSYEITLERK